MRTLLKQRRQAVTNRTEKEQAIAEKLLPFFLRAKNPALYYPIQSEVNILPFLPDGKHYLLPKMKPGYAIEFYPGDNLVPGPFHVMEPAETEVPEIPDLIVVPLLGFSKTNRIGYGKGYYDRYLAAHPNIRTIGIAFDEQEADFTPNSWDQPLDYVITPTRIIERAHEKNRTEN